MGIVMGLTPFPSCKFKKALNNDVAIIELIRYTLGKKYIGGGLCVMKKLVYNPLRECFKREIIRFDNDICKCKLFGAI